MGWNKVPSETDKKYAGILYPFKVKPVPTLPTNGQHVNSAIGEMGSIDTFYFDVERAGTYRIETFGRIDTVISLFGPDTETRMVAKDDDGGRGLSSRILASLAAEGLPLEVLRDELDLSGTKQGCDGGECGACTVLVDGQPRLACITLAASVLFHPFWSVPEAQQMVTQLLFMKNISVVGGMLLISALGAGALSLDERRSGR